MGIERFPFEEQLTEVQPLNVTEAAVMTENDRTVLVTLPADGSYNLTLPNVSKARGVYTIRADAEVDAVPGTVVVQDADEGGIPYAGTMKDTGDYIVLFCDGLTWLPLAEDLTA